MTKVTLSDVANISGAESAAIGVLNANSDLLTTAIENTLSRDGTSPNSMAADLDMDNNDILNVNAMDVVTLTVNGVDVTEIVGIEGPTGPQGPTGDVSLNGIQTLTNKTLTQPTLTLKQSTTPTPTAEGDIQWDTDDNVIVVGDGAAQKIFVALPASTAAGDLIYLSGTKVLSRLAAGTALQTLRQNSGLTAPEWATAREVLTTARTYYVRTDGSDSNTGLVNNSGGAFLTIQKAVDTVAGLDCSIYTPTIQVGAGTYTGGVTLKSIVGADVIIVGDETTPANVLISVTSATCFFADGISGVWHLRGVKMQTTTAGNCITAANGAKIKMQNVAFGACASFHMQVYGFATITLTGNYSITAGALAHLAINSAFYGAYGRTITLTGAPAWGLSMFDASMLGAVDLRTLTFSGAATGKRYNITSGGVIDTNGGGASFIPGSVAGTGGTTTGGGFYI